MLEMKWTGWLSGVGVGRRWHFLKEQTHCPLHVQRVGGQWSRGVKIHFINLVESVNFKENRPICTIYTQKNTCSKCEAYLLLPINNNDTVETVLPQSLFLVLSKNRALKKEHCEWNPLYKNIKQNQNVNSPKTYYSRNPVHCRQKSIHVNMPKSKIEL